MIETYLSKHQISKPGDSLFSRKLFCYDDRMKRIIVICTLLVFLISLSASEYYIGADGGVTFNTVIAGSGYRDYKYDWRQAYKAEVTFAAALNNYFALESGISMYEKNYEYSQSVEYNNNQTNFDYTIRNGFLSFPFSVRSSYPIKDFSFFLSLGGYVGVWIYGFREGTAINQNGREVDVSEKTDLSYYNDFDGGIRLRVGADYKFYSFKIYTALEYLYSISDMNKRQKRGAYPIHNSTFAITVGLLYRINGNSTSRVE